MRDDAVWSEHADATTGAVEGTAWLRTAARLWLGEVGETSCGHIVPGADTFLDVAAGATVCGRCAVYLAGDFEATCARCGDDGVETRRRVAELGDGQYASVPLCSECALLERLPV